jgi:hypothetical protein
MIAYANLKIRTVLRVLDANQQSAALVLRSAFSLLISTALQQVETMKNEHVQIANPTVKSK